VKITPSAQPTCPPANKPKITEPVTAKLEVPVYYNTERGPVPSNNKLFAAEVLAETVLAELEQWAKKYHFALVHIGLYNPRPARTASGAPILKNGKPRWSGHAYALGIDFKGIITENGDGDFLDTNALADGAPKKFQELLHNVRTAIAAKHREAEIVKEPSWYHLGLKPVGGW
jgi:hypothetical protein